MIRKLISLPDDLEKLISLTSIQEHKPQSEVIREKLCAGFAVHQPKRNAGTALLEIAKHAVPGGDPNGSLLIDTYLYDA